MVTVIVYGYDRKHYGELTVTVTVSVIYEARRYGTACITSYIRYGPYDTPD
jgi:hypothetical protein